MKGKLISMQDRTRTPNANDVLTSYDVRMSPALHSFMRDLRDGEFEKGPVGRIHMGTFGAAARRRWAATSDVLDENNEPRPRITPLGLRALERYDSFDGHIKGTVGKISDTVLYWLLHTAKRNAGTARQNKPTAKRAS